MPDPSGLSPPYLDPSQYPAYLDLQRKQMLAQALMQGSQQMSQTPQDWNSMRVIPKRSALSSIAPVLAAGLAGKTQKDLMGAQTNYFQGLMGGNAPPPTAAPAPSAPPSAPGVAPLTAQMPPTAAQSPAQQAPSPNQAMLLTGEPRTSQALLSMMGPQEYAKALAGRYAPTDLEKLLRAAGIDPASQQGQQALQANIQKQNFIPNENLRQGTASWNPVTHQFEAYNPNTAPGSVPTFQGGMPTGVAQLPGAEAAETAAAAGKAAGTVSQTPLKLGVDAQGRDVYEFPKPPALGQEAAAASPRTGLQAPKVGQPSGGGTTASKATLSAQEAGGKSGQDYSSELSKNATGATEIRRSLSELKNLSAQATPGAMNEGKMKLGSYMIAAGVSPETTAKWLGVDVGALQAAVKQTSTLAVGVIHSMTSRGTNFDLDTFMRNNPNLNMSDPSAFQKVVDYMDNKAKQEIAKQKDFVQWKKGVSPDEWEAGHTAHWLEQQNQAIDTGKTNSRPPLSSFIRP